VELTNLICRSTSEQKILLLIMTGDSFWFERFLINNCTFENVILLENSNSKSDLKYFTIARSKWVSSIFY
jgi:hypothetical protein